MEYSIDKMVADDWTQVRSIYQESIVTGNATYEAEAPGWDSWNSSHMQECRVVDRAGSSILGWAALSPISNRCVYSGVAEVSVYVADKEAIVKDFPRTPQGKLLKRELRKHSF